MRCLRRIGRRGLAGACIEGMLASSAAAVAVMDADLQHDETLLPRMLASLEQGADLVVGTRFAAGGTALGGLSRLRHWGSQLATAAARRILGVHLSDPMSGFFMMRRELFEAMAPRLSTQGFKVLLDIVASSRQPLRIVELPFEFRPRRHGQSKLDSLIVLEYLGLLLAKLSRDWLSLRFVLFALVGASGLFVHLFALRQGLALGLDFDWAQTLAAYRGHDLQFRAEQPAHLSRPTPAGVGGAQGPAHILRHLQRRDGCERRRRQLGLRQPAELVARRHGGRHHGGRVQLCRELHADLAAELDTLHRS